MRVRFSLKFLLLITALVAFVLAVIQFRPPPQIKVAFQSNDAATINGTRVDGSSFREAIDRERSWRKIWLQNSDVLIYLPESLLLDENSLLGNNRMSTIEELINPSLAPPRRSARLWDVTDLLEKHGLSDLANMAISGINRGDQIDDAR